MKSIVTLTMLNFDSLNSVQFHVANGLKGLAAINSPKLAIATEVQKIAVDLVCYF